MCGGGSNSGGGGGGSNNSGGSNSGSSYNNSGSSYSNSGNSNSGNKSGGGGGNNNGGSNNKKPETRTPPPPKTETTGSENSGGSSPPPPGHPEHTETATLPNEEETTGGSQSGSGATGGSEETSSRNTGGSTTSPPPPGHPDYNENTSLPPSNHPEQKAGTPGTALPGTQVPGGGLHGDGDGDGNENSVPKSPSKDIKDNITHIQKVTAKGFEKRDGDLSSYGVTMHTEVSEDGVIQVSFDGMKVTSLSSIIQSFVSVLGFDIIGHDKFVNHLKGIIDDAKKKHDNVTVDFTGFSQGVHIAMDIAEEIATYSINDDKIKMGTVVAIDALGMHENDIKKFNDAAEKTGMKLVTITASSVDNAVTISEVVFGALAYANGENWVIDDDKTKHKGQKMFTKILQALENNNKSNILEYVGQDSAYNPGYIQPAEDNENTDDDDNVIHLISNGETTPKNAKVSTLAVAGTDKDDIIKVADQPNAGQVKSEIALRQIKQPY